MGAMALAGLTSMNPKRFRRLLATSIFTMALSAYLVWVHYAGG